MQQQKNQFSTKLTQIIATFFFVGKISKAPGTFGTLATIPLWFCLSHLNIVSYMVSIIVLIIVGVVSAQFYQKISGEHDSKEVVIDEVVGFLITMTWLPVTWQSVVFGFVLFRFFDIVKPPPIRQFDRKIKGGVGVMVDDIAAGLICNIILQSIYTHTSWLGAQIQTF